MNMLARMMVMVMTILMMMMMMMMMKDVWAMRRRMLQGADWTLGHEKTGVGFAHSKKRGGEWWMI